jgi:hypothetical protein
VVVDAGVERARLHPLIDVIKIGDVLDGDLVDLRCPDLVSRLVTVRVPLEGDSRVLIVVRDLEWAGGHAVLGVVLAVVFRLRDRRGGSHAIS